MKLQKQVTIYARVGTRSRDVELQLIELRKYVINREWTPSKENVDVVQSGAKDLRSHLNLLMKDAKIKQFDVVLCWKFDR